MPCKTPISVLVLIHTTDLQVLLLERADRQGYWQSVTGSQEQGESLLETAMREVREETGLPADAIEDWQTSNIFEIYPHWRHRYAPGVTHNTEHLFALELSQPLPVFISPQEHLCYVWVDWREAAHRVFSWTNVEALRQLGHRHGLEL